MKIASLAFLLCLMTGCWFSAEPRQDEEQAPSPAPAKTSTPATPQVAPSSNVPPGTCAPAALCGGVTSCTDHCYGEKCCSISCQCGSGDDRTHLYCSQSC